MFVGWGPDLGFLYNDAFAEILGSKNPVIMGQRFDEISADVFLTDLNILVGQTFAGEATQCEDVPVVVNRNGFDEQANFTFACSPVRSENDQIAGVFCVVTDTTRRVMLERRQAFTLSLDQLLKSISDPDQILSTAARALGKHLSLQRVGYAQIQPDNATGLLTHCYFDSVEPLYGAFQLDSFGKATVSGNRAGQTVACDDVRTDSTHNAVFWDTLQTRSFVSVPLIRSGSLRATLYVSCLEPRQWLPGDVALIEEVAARTWDAAERARDQAKRRRAAGRLSAMVLLGDRLRDLKQPDLIAEVAGTTIGLMLNAAQAAYGVIHADGDSVNVLMPWRRSDEVISLEGIGHISNFGSYVDQLRRGESVIVSDVTSDPRTIGQREVFAASGIQAFVNLPLFKAGYLVGIILVFDDHPRVWNNEDLTFLRSVADRTWAALETAAADAELRALNLDLEGQVEKRTLERDRVWRNSQDLLCIIDLNGVLVDANPAWTTILGWKPEQVIGRHYLFFAHPEEKIATAEAVNTAEAENSAAYECRLLHIDGSYRWLSWRASRENVLIYPSGRHITAEKKATEALHHAEELLNQSQKLKAMGELVGGVAHDFNNLLTPIIGSLDLLSRRDTNNARDLRLIDGAFQSAERAKTLVQRLLAFARRQPLQPRASDIGQLISGMGDLITSTIGPQIRLTLAISASLPPASVDPNQVELAILNLCINARDAMPAGGALRITTVAETLGVGHASSLAPGQYVLVSIADTGEGMDAATMTRAVEPFFSTKGVGKGTGLGLSMVEGLASQLGGALVLSSTVGRGTTVELLLPVSSTPIVPVENRRVETADVEAAGRILLVDDEAAVRMITADMLADLGYDVVMSNSAIHALGILDSDLHIDAVVTDHLMPGMTGADLACAIEIKRPGMAVLIVSGFADIAGIALDIPLLSKPFRQSDLAVHLAKLLKNPRN